jgi:MYXO-CTERM domain-containing protein
MAKNSALREILASIPDHDLEIGNDSVGTTCLQTADIVNDPLTQGLTGWKYAQTNTVSGGDTLIRFPGNGATASLAAAARIPSGGEVIVFGDVEGFWTAAGQCLDSGLHAPLWRNLYHDESAAVDDDGDGYPDGVDCDDQDPDINPDEEEDCLNGRDDDCDGDVDGDDSDCPETGDDDAGDDDATGGGGFGDDDSDRNWDTGCNCISAVAGGGSSAGLALLLLGLVASVRRRLR